RLARPTVLVDLNRVPGLDGIDEENGAIRIGALVRQSSAERARLVRERCPLLAESLPLVGHFATRNRGTIGGSIAHADAAADRPELLDVGPLLGSTVDDDAVRSVGASAAGAVDPPPNLHGTPQYRRALLGTLVGRALRRAWIRATEASP